MNTDSKVSLFYENGVFQDFYQLLGVSPNASIDQIKKNYRNLSRIYHPDSKTGNEEKMKLLSVSYRVLKDPEVRNLYDQYYNKEKNVSHFEKSFMNHQSRTSQWNQKSQYDGLNKESFDFKIRFTEKQIRETLRRNHVSEFKIEDFLYWCRKKRIEIYSEKALSTYFSEYLSYCSQDFNDSNFSEELNSNTNDKVSLNFSNEEIDFSFSRLIELRQMLIRTIILEKIISSYFQSSFKNLKIYPIDGLSYRFSYCPVSSFNIVFPSVPIVKSYKYSFYL